MARYNSGTLKFRYADRWQRLGVDGNYTVSYVQVHLIGPTGERTQLAQLTKHERRDDGRKAETFYRVAWKGGRSSEDMDNVNQCLSWLAIDYARAQRQGVL